MKRLVLFLLTCKELMQLFLREGQCWAGRGAKVKGEHKEGSGVVNSKEKCKFTSVAFFLVGSSSAGYANFSQTNMSQDV